MQQFDEAAERLEAGVRAVEAASGLEVIVRIVPWSGTYEDIGWRSALQLAVVGLVAMIFAPFVVIGELWVAPLVMLFSGAGWLLGQRARVIRWQTTAARREQQVLREARACFYDEGVGATRGRTGVLLYASALEDRALTLRDHPLEGKAPLAEWSRVDALGRPDGRPLPTRLLAMLDALAALGPKVAPRSADDANELPDTPRIGR